MQLFVQPAREPARGAAVEALVLDEPATRGPHGQSFFRSGAGAPQRSDLHMGLFLLASAAAALLPAATDAGASVVIDMYSDAQCPCSAQATSDLVELLRDPGADPPLSRSCVSFT